MGKQEIAVIGDAATCTGFRLAGIQQSIVAEGKNAEKALEEMLEKQEIGIIIMNEKLSGKLPFNLRKKVDRTAKPVVITVPDKTGPGPESEGLQAMIRRAIGFELL